MAKKHILLVLFLVFALFVLAGCGETINGLSKDMRRIGKGVKTVFMRGD